MIAFLKRCVRWVLRGLPVFLPRRSLELLKHQQDYLLNEVSELRTQMRHFLAQSSYYADKAKQTRASFDFQWKNLPTGKLLLSDGDFEKEAVDLLCRYTELPAPWFVGKKVLDAGCGNGRWSYALCSLGAQVHSVDASEVGIAATTEACAGFPSFSARRHNLLEPLGLDGQFDFVWCFGVIHHTGDTHRALRNVAACVAPKGKMFVHVYGEPRPNHVGDYEEVNTYVGLRREIRSLDFERRVEYLREKMKDDDRVHTWFDAASPPINDLHRFDEIANWLSELGFTDIRRTFDDRNLFIMASRS